MLVDGMDGSTEGDGFSFGGASKPPSGPQAVVVRAVERAIKAALRLQQPIVAAHIKRLRRSRPDASPADVLTAIEKHYLATVTTLGAAAGGSAAVPGATTPVSIAINVAEIPAFIDATALFALAYAEVHGVHIDDLERRRTLVLAVLFGDAASKVVQKMAARTGRHWGRQVAGKIPLELIRKINRVLGRNFVTRYGTREGILVLGREVPFGIGALIGGIGNRLGGHASIKAARRAFGPAPTTWPEPPPDAAGAD